MTPSRRPGRGDPPASGPVLAGLRLLRQRRWHAAHDAFEPAWLAAAGDRRRYLHALIHCAVALEHLRRGNPRGARSQLAKARARLEGLAGAHEGVAVAAWCAALDRFFARLGIDERVARQRRGEPQPALPDERTWPQPEVARDLEQRLRE